MLMTKIVATLGPSTSDVEIIKKLIQAGINAARINFSHGTYESHGDLISKLKIARKELNRPVALMLDTKGPEIRIKNFAQDKIYISQGNLFTLTTQDIIGDESRVTVSYNNLPKDLHKGSRILIDDGMLELKVINISEHDITCKAINSGFMSSYKGVNIPGAFVNLPALTQKDIEDLKFGIKMRFDFVAASFIRSPDDVLNIRKILDENNGEFIKIIAKIENQDGVNNIDAILKVADGIMVARGDLGVEIPPEEVPLVQKLLIKKANEKGKPVITATQMLESMTNNLRPTRAEANDVANAILDGSDAIMLSGETAKGSYPVESVKMMARIALKTEGYVSHKTNLARYENFSANTTNSISYAACNIAQELGVACIATVTDSGFTARMLSKFRPSCPILAITSSKTICRQLSLTWGCLPVLSKSDNLNLLNPSNHRSFDIVVRKSMQVGLTQSGDAIVIAAGIPIGLASTTNTIRVQMVGGVLIKGLGIGTEIIYGRACVIKLPEEANKYFEPGDIIVTPRITQDIFEFIKLASGVIVGTWSNDEREHAENIFELFNISVIVCNDNVIDIISHGIFITLDPVKGFVYTDKKY